VKYVWDTSALLAAMRASEQEHIACYGFLRNNRDRTHIIPALAWFEVQAALSRIEKDRDRVLRELFLPPSWVLNMDLRFIREAAKRGLHARFSTLRGADLVFACAAVIEDATLVTLDRKAFGRPLPGLSVHIPVD
jgi:predicted nucleic acid-binding protein